MKIIKIGAIWCPGCLVMKKVWKNIIADYGDSNIIELDYDMDSEEVAKYNPGKILPVVIFMDKDNNEIDRIIGETKEEVLRRKIDEYNEK